MKERWSNEPVASAVAPASGRERAEGANRTRSDRCVVVVAEVPGVLESFAMGGRLDRGRNYARRGQVISLDVLPGEVRAQVQGSRVRPYRVTIGLAAFSKLVWAKAEIALSEQALPSAKLLAGEVPPELEEIFAQAGAPLFRRAARELDQRCSCPDGFVPCKHLVAAFYYWLRPSTTTRSLFCGGGDVTGSRCLDGCASCAPTGPRTRRPSVLRVRQSAPRSPWPN